MPIPALAVVRVSPDGAQVLGTASVLPGGFFVTTKHVTGADDSNLQVMLPRAEDLNAYQDTSDTNCKLAAVEIVAIDPFMDLCVLRLRDGTTNFGLEIMGTDSLKVGSPVLIYGFPHADHNRLVLTEQRANVGARILISTGERPFKHIVLNVQTRPGQSGGPVLDEKGRLVAVIIGSYAPGGGGGINLGGIDPHTLHQTTHAISAEYLDEMMS
jgi:S1-C subfamily serine protease